MPGGNHNSTPEEAIALVGLLRSVIRDELRSVVREEIGLAMRPVVESAGWFCWRYGISESTFYREIERCRIARRDCHGALHVKGAGPVRYSVAEWERKSHIHTRSIRNDLRRAGLGTGKRSKKRP